MFVICELSIDDDWDDDWEEKTEPVKSNSFKSPAKGIFLVTDETYSG